MTIRSFLKAACITIAFSSGSALAGHHEKGEMSSQTIVEVAIGAEQVSTLVTAIKAAGLVETLSSEDLSPYSLQQMRRSQISQKAH